MIIRPFLILLIALAPIAAPTPAPAKMQKSQGVWSGKAAPRGDDLLKAVMIEAHAAVRRAYHAPPLAWNDALADDALVYAKTLTRSAIFGHDPQDGRDDPEGENLTMGTRGAYTYAEMTQFWADERRDYKSGVFPDVSRSGDWSNVGHYTQMVWPGSREVGCAVASNAASDFLVCRYAPAGNVVGIRMR